MSKMMPKVITTARLPGHAGNASSSSGWQRTSHRAPAQAASSTGLVNESPRLPPTGGSG